MNPGRTTPSVWLPLLAAAVPAFAQMQPAGPKLTPLPHPGLPDPVAVAASSPPWLLILGVAAGAALLIAIICLVFRNHMGMTTPSVPPLTLAHRRLLNLLAEAGKLEPAETGHQVSAILRDYQMGRYHIPAPFRTREELYDRHQFATDEERRGRFASIARTCDDIAFSPAPATRPEAESLVKSAIETLRREVFHAEGELQAPDAPPTVPDASPAPAAKP